MMRTLLTTTALAAVLTTGALAAETTTKTDADTTMTGGAAIFQTTPDEQPLESQNGYFSAAANQILASSLIGKSLYNGTGENAEAVGDVNDVVLAKDGRARAVVVGIGGFLGIGEKDVAVDFSRVNWVERDGERWLTINATQEELEKAPAFDRSVLEPGDSTAMSDETVKKDTTAMVSEQPATGTTDAAAVDENHEMPAATASAEELIGSPVYGAREEAIGEVGDVIVSDEGQVQAVILDVGGVLGLGEKPVEMRMASLDVKKDADGELHVYTQYSKEDLEAMPEYDGKPATTVQ